MQHNALAWGKVYVLVLRLFALAFPLLFAEWRGY